MEHHFYLPQLTEENIATPNKYGQWFNNDRKIILGISDGIIVDENAITKGVSSIPDIWARPLLFHSAIRENSKHPLRKRCVQEWRGLMSLLALHKINPDLANLVVEPVGLDSGRFSTALRNLLPNSVQLEDGIYYEWNHILMIKFEDIPIGAFSPSTLVYTGSDYNKKLIKKTFPLMDSEGYLSPPKSKREGIENVGEWLNKLLKKLDIIFYTEESNHDYLIISSIRLLIKDWLQDIRTSLDLNDSENINVLKYKPSDDVVDIIKPAGFLRDYNVYRHLLKPLVVDPEMGVDLFESEVALESSRKLQDFKNVIVINEKLLEEDIYLWGEQRSQPLGPNPTEIINKHFNAASGTKIGGVDYGDRGGMWIRPELFFLTDDLLKSKQGDILNADEHELNVGTRYILPFRKEILQFYSPKEIQKDLCPTYKEDNGIVKFSFTLPLVGGEKVKIEKAYRTRGAQIGEGNIIDIQVPVIEIFPNYLGDNWRRYYLAHSGANEYNISPIILTENTTITNRTFDVLLDESKERVRLFELKGTDCFPEGIEVVRAGGAMGIILLVDKASRRDEDIQINILKGEWEIGIDFGTSNTNVYRKEKAGDASRWRYRFPEYIRSVTNSDSVFRNGILNKSFIPSNDHELPISTALLNRYQSQGKPSLLLDYFIFFPALTDEYVIPRNVYTNLKWEHENQKETTTKTEYSIDNTDWFIECLLFLLFLEICKDNIKNVTIGCSYPKAFSQDDKTRFQKYWENALEKLYNGDDRILDKYLNPGENKPHINGPYLITEGVAAGFYFANTDKFVNIRNKGIENATIGTRAICLDVGGRTTDVSIWLNHKVAFDSSILLAGSEISEYIRVNQEIWNKLFSLKAVSALTSKRDNANSFAAVLNLVLKEEEKEIYNNLSKNISSSALQGLRKVILLEFGALAYYTGILCIAANSTDEGNGLIDKIQNSGINIYWGGNGSKLISWLDYGLFTNNSNCVKFLNTLFFYSLKLHNVTPHSNIIQFPSPEYKSEACGGLIVSDIDRRELLTSSNELSNKNEERIFNLDSQLFKNEGSSIGKRIFGATIVGENIELNDNTIIESSEFVVDGDLFGLDNRTKLKSTSLKELETFIKILNSAAVGLGLIKDGNQIELNENQKAKLRNIILNDFVTLQGKKINERRLESIFIMEVKQLLKNNQ